ncbi:major facilitator superfamily domain-containing protein [Xylariales sp. PMI_506]|nr:major facilitator superfamily domain-containing protein [Xylariales sp. PMI_506]
MEKDLENVKHVENAGSPAEATARRPGYIASGPEDQRLDRRINMKMDFLVVLFLAAGFLFQGIDKANIGNAATSADFVKDTHILATDISNSVSLFSATYVPFMPISVALGRIIGPRWWIPIMLLSWGAVTTAQCAINSRGALYGLRLALGIFEAGYVATSYYYVGTLYPTYMAGLRMGLVSTSFTLSGAFGSLIAYGIFHLHSSRWADWQMLFLIQGSITLVLGFLCLVALPGKLSTAWFLTEEERNHAVRRMEIDTANVDVVLHSNSEELDHKISVSNILAAFKDWRKILIIVWTACATVPAYGFAIFLPLIVSGMGYQGVQANLMSVPPFMVAAMALITLVWISDRFKERSLVSAAAMFVSIIGYIGLIVSSNNKVRYGFLFVVMIGAGSINPLSAAWLNDNTPDKATRSIIMGIYGWNNVAGVIAGQVYSSKYGPSYRTSASVTLGIVALGTVGFVISRVLYMLENKKRKAEIEGWSEEQFEEEQMNGQRRGHEKKYFLFGY